MSYDSLSVAFIGVIEPLDRVIGKYVLLAIKL